MNWQPALGIWGWLALGLVPPAILALYFLKLRRTPVEVPSTYLWTRTIEDLHVNSIWQRLRNSLLLLLQLLLAGLLIVACLGPEWQGETLAGNRFIFLVDQSASMSAKDAPDGMTRLEFAKREIGKLIDSMDSEDSAMLISFSDRANVQQSYTRNRSLLKKKLGEIQQTQRPSDMSEALVAASGLANPGRTSDRESSRDVQVADALAATMFIFSDGAVRTLPNFSLGNLTPEYRPVGSIDTPFNVGITAFAISDDLDAKGLQVFARLENRDDESHALDVELHIGGELFDVKTGFEIDAEDSRGISFDISGVTDGIEQPVTVELKIVNDDVYPLDNTAYGVVKPPRKAQVLVVTRNNPYLKFALETDRMKKLAEIQFQEPSFLNDPKYVEQATLGFYDLVVFDQCSPPTMPQCNTVFWGSLPKGDAWTASEKKFPTLIVDSDQTHPVMFNLSMANVLIVESRVLSGPKGALTLVESTEGPIVMIGPREGYQDLVVGFTLVEYDADGRETINSDWPNSLGFPLFLNNVLVSLGGSSKFNASTGYRPGQLIKFKTRLPTPGVTIETPDGRRVPVKPRPDHTFVFGGAESVGVYQVRDDTSQELDQVIPVNLLDSLESDLAVRDKLSLGYEEVSGKTEQIPETYEFWTWVLLAALLILILEWFIYNRRVLI